MKQGEGGRVIYQLKENVTTFLEILKTNYKKIAWEFWFGD